MAQEMLNMDIKTLILFNHEFFKYFFKKLIEICTMIPTNVGQVSSNPGNTHQPTKFDYENAYFIVSQSLILMCVDIT
jgi:hypothetical protein